MASPDRKYVTVTEAVQIAGCTDGYIRRLLREEKLTGWRAGERAWLVELDSLMKLRGELSTRSNLRVDERKSLRKSPKKKAG
jgi:excisionase family DNA binding protein